MKKILIITGFVLLLLIILIFLISSLKHPKSPTSPQYPQISPIPTQYGAKKTIPKTVNPTIATFMKLPPIKPIIMEKFDYLQSIKPENTPISLSDIKNGKVYQTENLEISYSPTLKKYIFTRKTNLAQKEIDEWARANDLINQINNPDLFTDSTNSTDLTNSTNLPRRSPSTDETEADSTLSANLNLMADLFALLFNTPIGSETANFSNFDFSQYNKSFSLTSPTPFISPIQTLDNLTYFSQCNGAFDNYPLPQGCTLCKAGCGPTTASMVLASYVKPSANPPYTVDFYQSFNAPLGCSGSSIGSLKQTIESHGIKTTPYLVFNRAVANQVVDTFKQYLKDGWTLVVVADFADNSPSCGTCGHFFWVVDVDTNDNIWALDVFYGRLSSPPFNENTYYPFPKYIAAFGVKK